MVEKLLESSKQKNHLRRDSICLGCLVRFILKMSS